MRLCASVEKVHLWAEFDGKLILLLFFMHCIFMAQCQNRSEAEISNEIAKKKSAVECGDTQKMVDKCFTDLPPHLMEFLTTPKIAVDGEQIKSKCTVFDQGMACFDEYTTRCLPETKLNIFQNNVEGARNFFLKFCKDPAFQRDYLRHRECFSHIQNDWVRCTENFHTILSEELHDDQTNVTNKFMEFCCARYAFENCIYNSARYKCYQNSATFAREMAKMLSDEKHFSNCRQYETALCMPNVANLLWSSWIKYFILAFLAFILMFRN